ncbi:DUF945 family protein [Desulfospira joergensenii]|uniref:DUF945 family protein n=1 Tax=Desulfospira joergensenii TaxID=53329 RepID=UPI0003B31744|nr:DUF945 family protein [Desulfospira joergensenii]
MRSIKFIAVISFISFAALASIPVATGMIMEGFLTEQLTGKTKNGAVEIINYDRGLFSSKIEWRFKADGLESIFGVREILLLDRADHGFFSVKSHTRLDKNPWFHDFLSHQLKGKNPLEMATTYNVFGNLESRISLKEFSLDRGGSSMKILPGQVQISMDKNGIISASLDWKGGECPGRFTAGSLTMDSQMQKASDYTWDGRISANLDHLKIDSVKFQDTSRPLELDSLTWEYTSKLNPEKKFLSFGMGYGFHSLEWGTSLVRDGAARVSLNRVDVPGWQWIMGAYSKTLTGILNDVVRAEPDTHEIYQRLGEVAGDIGFRFLGQCERLLKKGLEIRVADFKARLDQEGEPRDIRGDMTLSLKKNMTLAGFIPILLRPEAVFEIFDLKTSMTLPADMADQNPALVTPIFQGMETGLFIRDKDVLSHRAEILDSRLILNQREVYFE